MSDGAGFGARAPSGKCSSDGVSLTVGDSTSGLADLDDKTQRIEKLEFRTAA